jgi:hypothetical protein
MTAHTHAHTHDTATLTIEGVPYKIEDLSQDVKDMLGLYQRWSAERSEQLADLNKTDAALKTIMTEIVAMIKATTTMTKATTAPKPANDD